MTQPAIIRFFGSELSDATTYALELSMPDMQTYSTILESGSVGETLTTLDTVLEGHAYKTPVQMVLDVAETTYHDMQRGIEEYSEMWLYTDRELSDLQDQLSNSFFTDLERGKPVYHLVTEDGEFTMHLRFGRTHDPRKRIPTEYEHIDLYMPDQDAVTQQFKEIAEDDRSKRIYESVTDRL